MSTYSADPLGSPAIETTRWRIDPARSNVEFQTRLLWGFPPVKGRFTRYEGTLDLSAQPAVVLTIEAASIDTEKDKRDEHLRSPAFFGAEQHPYVRFVSESATLDGERLRIHGRLHAGGKTAAVDLEATLQRDGEELELKSTNDVDHRPLGMVWKLGLPPSPSRLIVSGRLVQDGA
ncbi:MAG TPA: YceI family protein [Solirubrobacterales bacterium]